MIRADVHERFRRVVARAIERADQAHVEHLARLRATRRERVPGGRGIPMSIRPFRHPRTG